MYRDFAEAICTEAELRASGERLGLDDYVVLRRRTITVLPVLAVIERALPEARQLDGLRNATADIIAWTNDLRSARRELEEGTDNLITVLARHHRCSLAEAAAKARTMLAGRMDDFEQGGAGGDRAELIRRARDGSLAWQRETRRNTTGSVTSGEPRRGVRALARHLAVEVDATGVVDDR
ncbi:terpene synthase family protein [Lentzea sp. NPDC042327]|uniref:terpene synthase family protein n=1 Tax=Lentzea sp. NPDC042327 TaxID=3154801 RepID=UPI0033C5FBE8